MDIRKVHFIHVPATSAGQRLDNFIRKRYPDLPKSRIYQMLRKGEVRLNKKRAKPETKIADGDVLRMPPIILDEKAPRAIPDFWLTHIQNAVLHEDDHFLILNKPAGIPVHGGSGQHFGVIDVVRAIWGADSAELAHRLDRDTSGVLVLGKSRAALAGFQAEMQANRVVKQYCCLVNGHWPANVREVNISLQKGQTQGGERMVVVRDGGQEARTAFQILTTFPAATLLQATLETGRTHQIRVSVQHEGHGIAGDDKYGQRAFNRTIKKMGFKGMFLHAEKMTFSYQGWQITAEAPLPLEHQNLLQHLKEMI